MNSERMRVLELLEQGKITAAEAAELLRALGEEEQERQEPGGGGSGRKGDQPRWFRVRVTETATGRARANVSIPYGLVNFGMRFAPGPGSFRFRKKGMPGMPHHVDDLIEALRTGKRGTIFDVTDNSDGERIEIIVE